MEMPFAAVNHSQADLGDRVSEVAGGAGGPGGGNPRGHGCGGVVDHPGAEPLHGRVEVRSHRGDVRLDPVAPIQHARRGVARRAQPV